MAKGGGGYTPPGKPAPMPAPQYKPPAQGAGGAYGGSGKSAGKSAGNSNKRGRPRANGVSQVVNNYKTAATGETRNSPYTDPNIIFWLGLSLIIAASWSSGRFRKIFSGAWMGFAWGDAGPTADYLNNLKISFSQFVFLFVLVISARAFPPLARIWLVMMIGMWILFLMKNPQVLEILSASAVPGGVPDNVVQNIVDQIQGKKLT